MRLLLNAVFLLKSVDDQLENIFGEDW